MSTPFKMMLNYVMDDYQKKFERPIGAWRTDYGFQDMAMSHAPYVRPMPPSNYESIVLFQSWIQDTRIDDAALFAKIKVHATTHQSGWIQDEFTKGIWQVLNAPDFQPETMMQEMAIKHSVDGDTKLAPEFPGSLAQRQMMVETKTQIFQHKREIFEKVLRLLNNLTDRLGFASITVQDIDCLEKSSCDVTRAQREQAPEYLEAAIKVDRFFESYIEPRWGRNQDMSLCEASGIEGIKRLLKEDFEMGIEKIDWRNRVCEDNKKFYPDLPRAAFEMVYGNKSAARHVYIETHSVAALIASQREKLVGSDGGSDAQEKDSKDNRTGRVPF